VALLRHCNSWPGGDNLSRELAVDRFHYFVVENSTVLALLEEPLGNDQGSSLFSTGVLCNVDEWYTIC
jgi:hypothetical protein